MQSIKEIKWTPDQGRQKKKEKQHELYKDASQRNEVGDVMRTYGEQHNQ